ncbi:permease prefix domain 1-containing protein [Alkalibacterium olivapovliticus]|uniref:Beta-carotene 15,15'-monooxygenase n=1 Tax=Alkalibacterium olivapovliticus TaxID=99907 RepID=A0A2T0W747_9LACT|nr:permease prefix domain 1-containing protein [Alkalibacterium olivapovliticus]PRY82530.1 hypothetical protein CLV38_11180 [Alkalibacterium olivapovliticus]
MNIIKEYVNQVFKTVPLTEETNQLRLDILANMEDKYDELIESGASEHEAIGVVIAEFGNVDELLSEMGIEKENSDVLENYPTMEAEAVDYYLEAKAMMGLRIGMGILSILIGTGLMLTFFGLIAAVQTARVIGIILMLVFLVIGIALLIIEGMRADDLKDYHKPFVLLPDLRDRVEEQKKGYKKSFALSIVLGVSFCILSLIPLLLGMLTSLIPFFMGLGMMLVLIGIGVMFFTYSGNAFDAYTVILANGKNPENFKQEVEADERRKKIDYIMDEIYWPIIVVIYFASSFIIGGSFWGWSWIIFVLGGALEGTIKSLFDAWE